VPTLGMGKIQYTIRNIPEYLGTLLRKEADKSSKSLNSVLLEATNDLWIASLACQHDMPLFSRDDHFSKLPQLVLV